MSQEEILKFLSKHKRKWFATKELREILNISNSAIQNNTARLRKSHDVKYKVVREYRNGAPTYYHRYNGDKD